MEKLKNVVVGVALLLSATTAAQIPMNPNSAHDDYSYKNYVSSQTSPNVASLSKYANIPVSLYTGIPEINIPLYQINQLDYSLPISLSYHASGIKVEETDSWVGAGWSLKAGGVIGRNVIGYPDDVNAYFPDQTTRKSKGYLFYSPISSVSFQDWSFTTNQTVSSYVTGDILRDTEPDLFFYDIPGYSGKFVMKNSASIRKVVQLPQTDLRIEVTQWDDEDPNGALKSFKITTPEGIQYIFDQREYAQNYSAQVNVCEGNYPVNAPFFYGFTAGSTGDEQYNRGFKHTTAWYISAVKLLNGSTIELEYQDYFMDELSMQREQFSGHKTLISNPEIYMPSYTKMANCTRIEGKQLREIRFKEGKVLFNANHQRKDVVAQPNNQFWAYWDTPIFSLNALSEILVYNKNDELVKGFDLNFENMIGGGFHYEMLEHLSENVLANEIPKYEFLNNRLILKSVVEKASKNGLTSYLEPHTFSYYGNPPSRFSFSQDAWGYFNGAISNTLLPKLYAGSSSYLDKTEFSALKVNGYNLAVSSCQGYTETNDDTPFSVFLTNRVSYLSSAKLGMLNSIRYPTKGLVTFEYEPNDFTLGQEVIYGGGMRIKKITTDPIQGEQISKQYSYFGPNSTQNSYQSYGKIVSFPQFARRVANQGAHEGYKNVEIYSHNQAPYVTKGSYVGYAQVDEFNSLAGQADGLVRSYFDVSGMHGEETYTPPFYEPLDGFPLYQELHRYYSAYGFNDMILKENELFPFAPNPNFDWYRGSLLKKEVYKDDADADDLVSSTIYSYKVKNTEVAKVGALKILKENTNINFILSSKYYSNNEFDLYLEVAPYYYISAWKHLSAENETRYDANGQNPITTLKYYKYDSETHKRMTSNSFKDSDGKTKGTDYTYPKDIVNTGTDDYSQAIGLMKQLNYNSPVIEKTSWVMNGSSKLILDGQLNLHKKYTVEDDQGILQNFVALSDVYHLEISPYLFASSFDYVSINNQTLSFDNKFRKKIEILHRNKRGGITSLKDEKGLQVSYLWDLDDQQITAEVQNAGPEEIASIHYEDSSDQSWGTNGEATIWSNSGKLARKIPAATEDEYSWGPEIVIPFNEQTQKYTLSAWIKMLGPNYTELGEARMVLKTVGASGQSEPIPASVGYANYRMMTCGSNEWKYYEVEIDLALLNMTPEELSALKLKAYIFNTSTQADLLIDDIRLHPSNAQMKTFSQKPLVGLSLIGDQNSHTTHFGYDLFGRLESKTGYKNRLMNRYSYHYAQNTEDHNYVRSKAFFLDYTINPNHNHNLNVSNMTKDEMHQITEYSDGLGRPLQHVNWRGSPLGKDIVQFNTYDQLGRLDKEYMPFVRGMSGNIQSNPIVKANQFYASSSRVAHTDAPYSQNEYENSPLSRLQEKGIGAFWALGSAHSKKFFEASNVASDVRKWNLNFMTLEWQGYFGAGELIRKEQTNEDGHKVATFFTKSKQLVLSRTHLTETAVLETYYVYDKAGREVVVIPPKAIKIMEQDGAASFNAEENELLFLKKYDHKGRLSEQKNPDKEWVYFVYNSSNKLVLSQDGVQRQNHQWFYRKYDVFGREIIWGECEIPSATNEQLQELLDHESSNSNAANLVNYEEAYYANQGESGNGYSQNAYPNTSFTGTFLVANQVPFVVNYYDSKKWHESGLLEGIPQSFSPPLGYYPTVGYDQFNTGRLVAQKVKVLADDMPNTYLSTGYFYDQKGRMIQSNTHNHLGMQVQKNNLYHYAGTLVKTRTEYMGSVNIVVQERFTYDHQMRLTEHYHKINNQQEVLLAAKKYNELGQLVENNLNVNEAGSSLQSVDYLYNTRGWLTQINDLNILDTEYRFLNSGIFGGNLTGGKEPSEIKFKDLTFRVNSVDDDRAELNFTTEEKTVKSPTKTKKYANKKRKKKVRVAPNKKEKLTKIANKDLCLDLNHLNFAKSDNIEQALEETKTHLYQKLDEYNLTDPQLRASLFEEVKKYLFEEVEQSSYNIDRDLWAMKINYNESNSFNTTPLYNGNIASTAWIAKVGDTLQLPVKSYAYQYDNANRLQQANYTERFLSGHHTYSTPHQTGNFDLNNLTYDANGNIKTLQRLSWGIPMDQFSYNYQQNSNKLLRVNDSIVYTFAGMDFVNKPDASAFYEYDSNGKLSSDNGVSRYTTVTYYSIGMPKKVMVQDKGEIHYIYDAMGTKLAQIPIHENSFSLRRDYLGALELVNGQPEFMHTAEGRALETQHGNYRYEYHLNDHLGNMRLAFSDRNQDGEINHQNEVLQVRDYYPFGQPHVPLGLQIGLKDKYLFNGKELQEDFGLYQYDFGARTFDPQLARWFSVDPLAAEFPWQSPFSAMNNNPIYFTDPDGRAAVPPDDHYINNDGSIQTVKTDDDFDRFYVQDNTSETGYNLAGQLNKNDAGLVQFPASGTGFNRYGTSDAGGTSTSPSEMVGQGDHYLQPGTAAALFGLVNKLNTDFDFNISLGDMSSSNGSDPWQAGFSHHKGHGHLGKRSGLDVDFRYLNTVGASFQSPNAFKSSSFSTLNNQRVYDAAATFGFTKNYQGTSGNLLGIKKVIQHNDHGHLGLQYKSLNWKYVPTAPTK